MSSPLILIDSSHLAFRCHCVNQKFNPKTRTREPFQYRGHITSAIYGFFKTLLAFRRQYPESHILCAFDSRSKKRHEVVKEGQASGIFDERHGYKAGRKREGDDYRPVLEQLDELQQTLPCTRVQCVKVPGEEADDIVGSYAVRSESAVIASSDHDFYQLLGPKIVVYDAMKGEMVTSETVEQEFGLSPHQMIDLGALMGDNSDNIPGVPGIGVKTGCKLLQKYGSIDTALRQLKENSPKKLSRAEKLLLENEDRALLCRELKQIRTTLDVPPLTTSISTDAAKLTHLFTEVWGFKSLLPHIDLLV